MPHAEKTHRLIDGWVYIPEINRYKKYDWYVKKDGKEWYLTEPQYRQWRNSKRPAEKKYEENGRKRPKNYHKKYYHNVTKQKPKREKTQKEKEKYNKEQNRRYARDFEYRNMKKAQTQKPEYKARQKEYRKRADVKERRNRLERERYHRKKQERKNELREQWLMAKEDKNTL